MQTQRQAHEAMFRAYDYEALTISSSALGLTATKYSTTVKRVLITAETNSIRYRVDGTDPTASEGHIINANDVLILNGYANIKRFKAIATGSDATLRCTFER